MNTKRSNDTAGRSKPSTASKAAPAKSAPKPLGPDEVKMGHVQIPPQPAGSLVKPASEF